MRSRIALPLVVFLIVALIVVIFFPDTIDKAIKYVEDIIKYMTSSPK